MIHSLKLLRLLRHTSCLQKFMTLLRKPQCHTSSRFLYISACFPNRTRLTDLFGKDDLDNRLSFGVSVEIPSATLLPLWTGDPLVPPVNLELLHIQGSRGASLPTRIGMDWSYQINVVGFSAVQDPRAAQQYDVRSYAVPVHEAWRQPHGLRQPLALVHSDRV